MGVRARFSVILTESPIAKGSMRISKSRARD
jgi:hypothetical protein